MAEAEKSWLNQLGQVVGEIGKIVESGFTAYGNVREQLSNKTKQQETQQTTAPPYNPNLTAGDYFVMPNKYLIGIGILLLVVVLLIRK